MQLNDSKNIIRDSVSQNMLSVRQPTGLIYTTHLSRISNAIKWTSRSNGRVFLSTGCTYLSQSVYWKQEPCKEHKVSWRWMPSYCCTKEGNNQHTEVQTHTRKLDDSHCKCQDRFTSATYHGFQGHKSSLSELFSVYLTWTGRPVVDQAYFIMSALCHISGKQKEVGEKNWSQLQIKGMYMDGWCFRQTEHYAMVYNRILIKWKGILHNPYGGHFYYAVQFLTL